jgi:hypothetical protein
LTRKPGDDTQKQGLSLFFRLIHKKDLDGNLLPQNFSGITQLCYVIKRCSLSFTEGKDETTANKSSGVDNNKKRLTSHFQGRMA